MSDEEIVTYTLRISKNLRDWMSAVAKSNRRSMNAELLTMIEKAKMKEKKELKEQEFKEA